MKRILLIVGSYLLSQSILAQEPADALRLSWTVPGGTARQQAIGGAMGSLGGDISATYVNPAGLAFYRTGDFVINPIYQVQKAQGSYLGRTENEVKRKLLWGTTGFVTGTGSQSKKVKNVSFALAYNRSADFNNSITYLGANKTSSYSQKYLEEIAGDRSGNSVDVNYPFGASLGFRTLWIDTVGGGTEGNFSFQSRSANILSTGLLQRQTIQSKGGIHEFAIAGAVNLNDKVMLGGTIGIPVLSYHRNTQFTEADATDNGANQFNYATVDEDIDITGAGINLKAGVIFKPEDYWRIGFAFHTPTLYSLVDKTLITVSADVERPNEPWLFATNEDIEGGPNEFRYTLVTPYKAIASISYVLRESQDISQQRGFLTADIEYVNYKASSYEPDEESSYDIGTKEYLKNLNRAIDNAYKGAFNFRAGGELKFTTFMLRAGVAYYGNPYQNINGEKGSKLNLSGGISYRDKGFFADLTYVHSIQKDMHFPYRLMDPTQYYGANIKNNIGNVLMTVGLKF